MEEATYRIRLATLEDIEDIKKEIHCTLASPEGKVLRKHYEGAVLRREMLVLERYDPKERGCKVNGFLEWRTRVDGTVAIKDAGSVGDEPHPVIIKRLVRELLHLFWPPAVTVKIRSDLTAWNNIFQELPGFHLEGSEYSRPYWKNIWTRSGEVEERFIERRPRGQQRR
ncbi:MAG: hypothetical protein M1136_10285 [Chloroflexi bacterium]|nr:hypothetical protein [Chloroflexota bacterium]MCL5076018.1 hypothetical protein [Chloroflexota bacterium]